MSWQTRSSVSGFFPAGAFLLFIISDLVVNRKMPSVSAVWWLEQSGDRVRVVPQRATIAAAGEGA